MNTIKQILIKPVPSPAPDIFEFQTIEIIDSCKNIQKIEVYKEFGEFIYNSLTRNSDMFVWTLKNNNLSLHHLILIFKIYSISSNQNLILKTITSGLSDIIFR